MTLLLIMNPIDPLFPLENSFAKKKETFRLKEKEEELTTQVEKKLSGASFIAPLENDIYCI